MQCRAGCALDECCIMSSSGSDGSKVRQQSSGGSSSRVQQQSSSRAAAAAAAAAMQARTHCTSSRAQTTRPCPPAPVKGDSTSSCCSEVRRCSSPSRRDTLTSVHM